MVNYQKKLYAHLRSIARKTKVHSHGLSSALTVYNSMSLFDAENLI